MTSHDSMRHPILEFASRTDGDAFGLIEAGATDEDARLANEALDEYEAETKASDIASRLRRAGHTL